MKIRLDIIKAIVLIVAEILIALIWYELYKNNNNTIPKCMILMGIIIIFIILVFFPTDSCK